MVLLRAAQKFYKLLALSDLLAASPTDQKLSAKRYLSMQWTTFSALLSFPPPIVALCLSVPTLLLRGCITRTRSVVHATPSCYIFHLTDTISCSNCCLLGLCKRHCFIPCADFTSLLCKIVR